MLADSPEQAADACKAAVLISAGIQSFIDSGTFEGIDELWEPAIAARHYTRTYGEEGWKKAAEAAGDAFANGDSRAGHILETAAKMMCPEKVVATPE